MTRTDGLVSSGPQTAGCALIDGQLRDRPTGARAARRGLLALPVALMALIAPAGPALAAGSETSGYGQTAPAPKTTPEPKKATAPSKKAATPTTTPTTTPAPVTTTASPKQSTLPFTGLDLRWIVGVGALMLGAGISLRLVQGRRRHGPGS